MLVSPRHPEVEAWALDAGVMEQLEQVRSGGWERSSREAETVPVIDTGRVLLAPDGAELPRARLSRGRLALRAHRRARHARAATAPTRWSPSGWGSSCPTGDEEADASADGEAAPGGARPRSAGVAGRARGGALPRPRLHHLPSALVGHPDPDRLLRAVRHRARAARAAARAAAARHPPHGHRQPAGRARGVRQHHLPGLRRARQPRDRHARLPLRRPVAVGSRLRAPRVARGLARGDPRAARPAPLAALGATRGRLGQRQLRVRPAHRHQGAARHRSAGVPRRRRALRRLPVSRDGHTRRAQDEQASGQRGRPRRAGGALRRRHRAPGGPLRRPPPALAQLERLGRAALPPLPRPGVGVHQPRSSREETGELEAERWRRSR